MVFGFPFFATEKRLAQLAGPGQNLTPTFPEEKDKQTMLMHLRSLSALIHKFLSLSQKKCGL